MDISLHFILHFSPWLPFSSLCPVLDMDVGEQDLEVDDPRATSSSSDLSSSSSHSSPSSTSSSTTALTTITDSSSSSSSSPRQDHEHLWKACLKKIESFRNRQKPRLSIRNMFNLMNARGTNTLPKREFIDNLLSLIHIITRPEAIAFADYVEINHSNVIICSELHNRTKKQSKEVNCSESLDIHCEHPIFTEWLLDRKDFQEFWHGATTSGGSNNLDNIERILEIDSDARTTLDLQTLMKFVKDNKLLTNVKGNRLMDISRVFRLLKCPKGTHVVSQGDPGDAFYIILRGTFAIDIDGKIVNTLGSGSAFGEKALENDAPRGASVTCTTHSSSLMVLLAFDYKSMVATAQAKQNQEITTFLHESCYAMNYLSHAKIAHIVRLASRQRFQEGEIIMGQNESPNGLMVIESGSVCITRNLIVNQESESSMPSVLSITSSSSFMPTITPSTSLKVEGSGYNASNKSILRKDIPIAYLHKGDIFGDDICRGKYTKTSYGAYAASIVDIIIINPNVANLYFKKGKTLELLMSTTYRLHRPDEEYSKEHRKTVRKNKILYKIRDSALQNSVHYRQKILMSEDKSLKSNRRSSKLLISGHNKSLSSVIPAPSRMHSSASSPRLYLDEDQSILPRSMSLPSISAMSTLPQSTQLLPTPDCGDDDNETETETQEITAKSNKISSTMDTIINDSKIKSILKNPSQQQLKLSSSINSTLRRVQFADNNKSLSLVAMRNRMGHISTSRQD